MLAPREVDFLVLGAGWTAGFLLPLLLKENISYAATTRDGRGGSIKFNFDPDSEAREPFSHLPRAHTVLITFPLKGRGPSRRMVDFYRQTHAAMVTNWILLGSTGIYTSEGWNDRNSEYDKTNARAVAEDELLELGGCVLCLAGLYGANRQPRNWLTRVAKTKEEVRGKKALHLIHGEDVARAVVGTHRKFYGGERWIVTDLFVYDWYSLFWELGDEVEDAYRGLAAEGEPLTYRKWVFECMHEDGVRALPRDRSDLGRVLDSRAFWKAIGMWPMKGSAGR